MTQAIQAEEKLAATSLGYIPAEKWTFDEEVTRVFDDMLARSIPDYEGMRRTCFDIGCDFIKPHTAVVDLGCSRGEALAPFIAKFGAANHFLGIDSSTPMVEAARQRFRGYIDCGVVEIREMDLRKGYPPLQASLTLAVLTLQFTPIEYRQKIIRGVWKHTLAGGAFVFIEKILGSTAELNDALTAHYHALKHANGYSQDEIDSKRQSLEGVLVPVTAAWNEEMLRKAGFAHVECVWRWLNFAGWLAIKE